MKLIFLDIDGVLNNTLWFESKDYKQSTEKDDYSMWFDPTSVENLNYLTNETGAKIVVSSSWRKGRDLKDLKKILNDNGVTGEVIGKTPYLDFRTEEYQYSVPRGCEIKAWMEMNKGILGQKISRTQYVILDDDSDMLYWQRFNYFLVDGYCGLTPNVAYRAARFLNNID